MTAPRFHVLLIGAFALLAVAMAAAGMYSVISCLVSQRTPPRAPSSGLDP